MRKSEVIFSGSSVCNTLKTVSVCDQKLISVSVRRQNTDISTRLRAQRLVINNASLISVLLLRCTHKKKVRAEGGENYPKAKLNESPTNIMRKESAQE